MPRARLAMLGGGAALLLLIAVAPFVLRGPDVPAVAKSATPPRPPVAAEAAQPCLSASACDAYERLRARERQPGLDTKARAAMARDYLAMGLPWRTVALARDSATGVAGRRGLKAMAEDAATVIPESAAGGDPLARRIWLTLGLPGADTSGPLGTKTRHEELVELGFGGEERANGPADDLALFRPALRALYSGKLRPDVEEGYGLSGARRNVFTPVAASPRDVDQWLSAARQELAAGREGPASEALERLLASHTANLDPAPDSSKAEEYVAAPGARWKVTEVRASNAGTLVSFGGDFMETAAIFLRRERGAYRQYTFGCNGSLAVSFVNVDGAPGDEVLFQNVWRSDNNTVLEILYPARDTAQTIAEDGDGDYLNQKVALLELDGDPSPEIAVNLAFASTGRYGDCTICPHQRGGYLLAFDRKQGIYRAIGSYHNGANEYGWGGSGMLVSPLVPIYNSPGQIRDIEVAVERASRAPAGPAMTKALQDALGYAQELQSGGLNADAARMLEGIYTQARRAGVPRGEIGQLTLAAGQALLLAGQPQAAYQRLRSIAEPVGAADRRHYRSTLGMAAFESGNLAEALDLFDRSRREGADTSIFASNRSIFYYQIGAWAAAEHQAKETIPLALRDSNGHAAGISMLLIAALAARNRDYESAIDWIARAVRTSSSADDAAIKSTAFMMDASIALALNRPQIAEALLDNALYRYDAPTWEQGGPIFLLLYGRLFEQEGKLELARKAYRAAALLGSRSKGVASVQAWAEVGRINDLLRRPRPAADAYRAAFTAMIEARRQIPTETFKLQFLQNLQQVADTWLGRELESGVAPEQLANDVEAWKYKVFSDVYAPASGSLDRNAAQSLGKALKPNEAYISYFIGAHGSFASVVTHDGIRTRRLALDPDRARGLRSDIAHLLDPADAAARAYIEARRVPLALDDALDRAYTELIVPLDLPTGIDTLVISPDEDLVGIPWAAIHASANGWWERMRWMLGFPKVGSLLDRYTLALAPSAELALAAITQTSDAAPRPGLVVAAGGEVSADQVAQALALAPVKGAPSLAPLEQAGTEAAAVTRSLTGPVVLADQQARAKLGQGSAATREAVLAALPRAGLLHFIGHGVFNAKAPMESALFLDQSAPPGQRVLTASDIARLDLRSVRFAALSACETGMLQADIGSESFGFLRALLAAHVRSAVLMGWQVDDSSTATFYSSFYRDLGSGAATAYRMATLAQKGRYSHPYYWAAGDYYGSWR